MIIVKALSKPSARNRNYLYCIKCRDVLNVMAIFLRIISMRLN